MTMTQNNKRGRPKKQIVNDELKRFVEENKIKLKNQGFEVRETAEARQRLRKTAFWKHINEELDGNELEYFEEQFVNFYEQFGGDITAAEETQVYQAIIFDVLMRRNLKEKKKCKDYVDSMQKLKQSVEDKYDGDFTNLTKEDRHEMVEIQTQIGVIKNSEQARSAEYIKLQEKHAELMKQLKATRDQRLKEVVDDRVSFSKLVQKLQDKKVKDEEGRRAELLKLAAEKELERLSKPHKYMDGVVDHPVLSHETYVEGERI